MDDDNNNGKDRTTKGGDGECYEGYEGRKGGEANADCVSDIAIYYITSLAKKKKE